MDNDTSCSRPPALGSPNGGAAFSSSSSQSILPTPSPQQFDRFVVPRFPESAGEDASSIRLENSAGLGQDPHLSLHILPGGQDLNLKDDEEVRSGAVQTRPMDAHSVLRLVVNHLLGRRTAMSSISKLNEELNWSLLFEEAVGPLREFLSQYPTIFVISTIGDSVVFRKAAKSEHVRRGQRIFRWDTLGSIGTDIGHVSCCKIADSFDLHGLESVYRKRSFTVVSHAELLCVSFVPFFDLFIFATGEVIWWGRDKEDHWIIEDDFVRENHQTNAYINNRLPSDLIDLFPVWFTFSGGMSAGVRRWGSSSGTSPTEPSDRTGEAHLKFYGDELTFDHFELPRENSLSVAISISFCLAESVNLDYLESKLRKLSNLAGTLAKATTVAANAKGMIEKKRPGKKSVADSDTEEVVETGEHLNKTDVFKFLGEIQLLSLGWNVKNFLPLFVESNPSTIDFYHLACTHLSITQRREWVDAKSKAIKEILKEASVQKFRKKIVKLDWILIWLLIVDVSVLLWRLNLAIFFRASPDDM